MDLSRAEQQGGRKVITRRSQLEMRMDVMRAIMEGAEGPTQIMYRANLSWVLLCEHLGALVNHGFVGEKSDGNRKRYSLTGKGLEIVRAYLDLIRGIVSETEAPFAQPL